jgi:hypothetical protein
MGMVPSGQADGTRPVKRRNHTVNGSYLTRFADDRGLPADLRSTERMLVQGAALSARRSGP